MLARSDVVHGSLVELYEACAQDDPDAFGEFYRRYQPELATYARRRYAEDPEGLADIVTFDTMRRLSDMRRLDEPTVRAYLYRTLKRRLVDESHRRRAIPLVPDDSVLEQPEASAESLALDRVGFDQLLSELTEAEREVVIHRFVGGYSSKEIGRRVGKSPDAVRRLQANAVARLRLLLAALALVAAAAAMYWLLASTPALIETRPVDSTVNDTPDPPGPIPGPFATTVPGPPEPSPRGGSVIARLEEDATIATGPTTIAPTTAAPTQSSGTPGQSGGPGPSAIGGSTIGGPATTAPPTTSPTSSSVAPTQASSTVAPTTTSTVPSTTTTAPTTTTTAPTTTQPSYGPGSDGPDGLPGRDW